MMVKLAAVTVEEMEEDQDESETVEQCGVTDGTLAEGEQMVCAIPAKPLKILLTKDLHVEVDDDRYAEGANIDAWYDREGGVFCWEVSWGLDPYYLDAEEFEALGKIEIAVGATEESTEPEPEPAEETGGWEAEALAEIKQARARVAMMEARHLDAKERAKDAKADWEAAVNHLTETIDTATKPLPLFDPPAKKPQTAEPTGTPPADSDEAWRATPIDVLFPDVERFGVKKQDAVREAIPTLGAFEDLRKKASLAGDPIKAHMPQGVGQGACDQLEEAALNWRKREAAKAAKALAENAADQ